MLPAADAVPPLGSWPRTSMRVEVDAMPMRSRLARSSDSILCLRWRSLLMPNSTQKSARPPKMIPNTVPIITPRGTLLVEVTAPKLEGSNLGVVDGSLGFGPMPCEGTSGWIVMFATIWREDKLGRIISKELEEDEGVAVVVILKGCVVEYERDVVYSEGDEEEKETVDDRGLKVESEYIVLLASSGLELRAVLDVALVASISDADSEANEDTGVL